MTSDALRGAVQLEFVVPLEQSVPMVSQFLIRSRRQYKHIKIALLIALLWKSGNTLYKGALPYAALVTTIKCI